MSETGGRCGYPSKAQGYYLIFAGRREGTSDLSASICGLTRPFARDDDVYMILAKYKGSVDEVYSDTSVEARR